MNSHKLYYLEEQVFKLVYDSDASRLSELISKFAENLPVLLSHPENPTRYGYSSLLSAAALSRYSRDWESFFRSPDCFAVLLNSSIPALSSSLNYDVEEIKLCLRSCRTLHELNQLRKKLESAADTSILAVYSSILQSCERILSSSYFTELCEPHATLERTALLDLTSTLSIAAFDEIREVRKAIESSVGRKPIHHEEISESISDLSTFPVDSEELLTFLKTTPVSKNVLKQIFAYSVEKRFSEVLEEIAKNHPEIITADVFLKRAREKIPTVSELISAVILIGSISPSMYSFREKFELSELFRGIAFDLSTRRSFDDAQIADVLCGILVFPSTFANSFGVMSAEKVLAEIRLNYAESRELFQTAHSTAAKIILEHSNTVPVKKAKGTSLN